MQVLLPGVGGKKILLSGFLLLISLTITTVIAVMGDWVMNHWTNIVLVIFYVLNFIISFGVVMLLYSSMIFFYGAEFTRAYADYFTGKVSPTDAALKITDKADAKH